MKVRFYDCDVFFLSFMINVFFKEICQVPTGDLSMHFCYESFFSLHVSILQDFQLRLTDAIHDLSKTKLEEVDSIDCEDSKQDLTFESGLGCP